MITVVVPGVLIVEHMVLAGGKNGNIVIFQNVNAVGVQNLQNGDHFIGSAGNKGLTKHHSVSFNKSLALVHRVVKGLHVDILVVGEYLI